MPYWYWAVLGGVFAVIEVAVPAMVCIWLAAGTDPVRGALKLSRANSAIPASEPIIEALSSGIRITFWLGVPANRPRASI